MGSQTIETTWDSRHVLVGQQGHVPTVWLEAETGAPTLRRTYFIYGTGQMIPGDTDTSRKVHRGSYQDGEFVWHIYEAV